MSKQDCKVFVGGLSWETTGEKLRSYFENFGAVREAFVSYNRNNGKPRGFGFVLFESHEVADKVVATKHTIDRREVEAKRAVPKDENAKDAGDAKDAVAADAAQQKTRKIFVGGLAPGVDDGVLRGYFEQFGDVEDAVVMYDHDNKRPRGFGFVSFTQEEAVDKVFGLGAMQCILEKQIEIKPAVPRDQMPAAPRGVPPGAYYHPGPPMQQMQHRGMPNLGPYGTPARPFGYSPHAPLGMGGFPPPPHHHGFRPPAAYPGPHHGYMPHQHPHMQPPPQHGANTGGGRPANNVPPPQPRSHQPHPQQQQAQQQQQYSGSLGSSPTVSMPSALSASLQQHQQQQAPAADSTGQQVSSASSYSGSGTGPNSNNPLQSAAAAANGYGDLYALSNGGNGMFATPAQAAALYNIANSAFPQHLNGMQTGASGVNSKLSSLGQQGLDSLKALAAGYSPYGGEGQHTGSYDSDADAYAGADATVFAEQVSTRMAGLTVGGGSYSSPFTSANTMGSGWSH